MRNLSFVRKASTEEVSFLRSILNYQVGREVAHEIIPEGILVKVSRRTGRIREVLLPDGRRLASIRASSFTFNFTLELGKLLHTLIQPPGLRAVVVNEVVPYVIKGSSVFSRHIIEVDEELRAGDEVLVVDESDNLLCTGRLILSPEEIMHFIRGPAIRLRECVRSHEG